jgi:predicted ATPase
MTLIRKIKVKNFKSFKDLEVELGKFNVLIGPNASGKSNFIQIFKFLRDIRKYGLDNAISIQGGVDYLTNINIGPYENLLIEIEVISDRPFRSWPVIIKEKALMVEMEPYEIAYRFTLRFSKKRKEFEIVEDKLIHRGNLVQVERAKNGKIKEEKKFGKGEIIFSVVNGKIKVETTGGLEIKKDDISLIPYLLEDINFRSKTLLFESPAILMIDPAIFDLFIRGIAIYDFDPKLSKKAIPITGKTELEEDGSNLAIVLKNILGDKEKKRKLSNLVKDLLPFVDNLSVEKFADKSLMFKLKESYNKKQYLPASLISDGTINITALIIALFFEKKPLTIIEEPERNIHPYLISKVVEMMKDASNNIQILVSTHNPEIVKLADLENLLLISRDKEGFSVISRPSEKENVKTFLKNEIGIEELYIQNLLEL